MPMQTRSRTRTCKRVEFGDFQTPTAFAEQVCRAIAPQIELPATVVEPTCGRGNLLLAALKAFPSVRSAVGVEVNPEYADAARSATNRRQALGVCQIIQQDFFRTDWKSFLSELPDPLLVLGNPPWVTNSAVGALNGSNLPKKTNFQQNKGLDAVTGKSNFDISEWMLMRLVEALQGRNALLAMLCKTAVARKVLAFAWNHKFITGAELRVIDANRSFGASVDACLLVCRFGRDAQIRPADAEVFPAISASHPERTIGLRDGRLVSNLRDYERTIELAGDSPLRWRSGMKHDCVRIMEFRKVGDRLLNGLSEVVDIEDDYLYPMLKSSDVAGGRVDAPQRRVLVTQRSIGEETRHIERTAPRTWQYLMNHAVRLDARASTIYRNRPRFSVFGIGDYTFADFKVAVSGLYKHLSFVTVGPCAGKPVVFDDTCAFVACRDRDEAEFIRGLLRSDLAQSFYGSRIFWDAKRPITAEILNELNLVKLAERLESGHPVLSTWKSDVLPAGLAQRTLF